MKQDRKDGGVKLHDTDGWHPTRGGSGERNSSGTAEKTGAGSVVKGAYFNLGFLDFLLAVLRNWKDIIVRFASNLL